ncbi:molybdopterin-binding protein [Clostridiaceae bacterium 35-E11]
MLVKKIKTEDAVGKVLQHDITRIVKGEFKGRLFQKGRIITKEDVPKLLDVGKDNIYILDLGEDDVHEDEAGVRLGDAVKGEGTSWVGPKESRVNIHANYDGLFKVNVSALEEINDLPNIILSTLPNNTIVKKGEMLAGTKVIPLVVSEKDIATAEKICDEADWIVKVLPFQKKRVGVIITGNEVFYKRIPDGFGPVIKKKVEAFGSEILEIEFTPDDAQFIASKIKSMKDKGADIIFVTGGMSVDPDDVTPKAIGMSGAKIEKYGAAALPGAMFMLAYLGDVPIMGIPACGMFFKVTVIELILPRLLAGEKVVRRDIVALGHGGLCSACPQCSFPKCSFGKGSI